MIEYDFRSDCDNCKGLGAYPLIVGGMLIEVKECWKCKGSGKIDDIEKIRICK